MHQKGEFLDKLKMAGIKRVTNMTNQITELYVYYQYCQKFMQNVLINK